MLRSDLPSSYSPSSSSSYSDDSSCNKRRMRPQRSAKPTAAHHRGSSRSWSRPGRGRERSRGLGSRSRRGVCDGYTLLGPTRLGFDRALFGELDKTSCEQVSPGQACSHLLLVLLVFPSDAHTASPVQSKGRPFQRPADRPSKPKRCRKWPTDTEMPAESTLNKTNSRQP
jgi:hypothetical protein